MGSTETVLTRDDCKIRIRDDSKALWQVYVKDAGHEGVEKGKTGPHPSGMCCDR